MEYFPLGQILNKGLDSDEKQEGLLKRLKNIEDKTSDQLDLIRDQGNRQLDLINKLDTGRMKGLIFMTLRIKILENQLMESTKQLIKLKRLRMIKKKNQNLIVIPQVEMLIILTNTQI